MPLDSKILCLGALDAGFNTGYDIRKAFEEGPFQLYQSLSYGSIYPALNALLAEGLATCTEQAQDGRPDKKVYAITDAGRVALRQALVRRFAFDRLRSDFMFAIAFAHLMSPDQVSTLLDEYAQGYRDLAHTLAKETGTPPPGRQFLLDMGREGCLSWARCIEEHRSALEEALRTGPGPDDNAIKAPAEEEPATPSRLTEAAAATTAAGSP
ncbi:PadR family transcriptional regulator [Roseospira marina]|uniref:PadR family transcriptional regulator n=1 Tax=Roseospira marina TaxID=140057 RepID=A0A5M6IFX5_9PROT|nr:PadR family transcriptional regulator [Roseospira marina]KAA5606787.1 PadR family transcriptional regulator [Roseospira marina]MBB4313791.1 DNA-binding PadR family transcriptional regulator [Roseospira marina]MBB5086953.1 DNA-binding PadR family transcriptional regulator [Roseospira marina]